MRPTLIFFVPTFYSRYIFRVQVKGDGSMDEPKFWANVEENLLEPKKKNFNLPEGECL